jgi:two-component system LytT family response regulator
MKTLRCLALDDEPLALELLEDNIRTVPFLQLVHSCQSSMEAMQVLQSGQIDLVFSDIQMPGLNGLQLITALPAKPMFILITAHEKFALEGYALDVVDYLLKPVAYERFVKACNKALERYTLRQQGASSISVTTAEAREFFFVPIDYKMVKIALNEVVRLEGVRDYIRVHFTHNRHPLLVRMGMKAAEDALPASKFIRIHKSHIVSISSITAVRKSTMFIDDVELPVGEQYRNAVQSLIDG